jgi:hypothetical protein
VIITIEREDLSRIRNFVINNKGYFTFLYLSDDEDALVITNNDMNVVLELDMKKDIKKNVKESTRNAFGISTNKFRDFLKTVYEKKEDPKKGVVIVIEVGEVISKITFSGKMFKFQTKIEKIKRRPLKKQKLDFEDMESQKFYIIQNPEDLKKLGIE